MIGDTELSEEDWELLQHYFMGDTVEVVVQFDVQWWYLPAKIHGPPERCHEEEGDSERIITEIEVDNKILRADSEELRDRAAFELLAEALQDEVDYVESDPPDEV
jgi:ribosomal protein L21E